MPATVAGAGGPPPHTFGKLEAAPVMTPVRNVSAFTVLFESTSDVVELFEIFFILISSFPI